MPNTQQQRVTLSKYRMKKAWESLHDAENLFQSGSYSGSNNRAYYAVFSALRALLATEGVDYKKHSGVIGHFQREYIKSGTLPKNLSRIVTTASLIRTASDYEDFYLASKKEAAKQVENAGILCDAIEKYLQSFWGESD